MYPPPEPTFEADDSHPEDADTRAPVAYRGASSDPTFGYLLLLALAVGLAPLIPESADMRYTLVWAVMAAFGVLAWLFGTGTRIENESADNLAWGIIFGIILAAPLILVGGVTLNTTVALLFRTSIEGAIRPMPPGLVLAYLVFVMPLAETLFFRGVIQARRPFWLTAVLSTLWSLLLFGPMLDLVQYPGVAAIIGVALVMMNLLYSYVRQRNGLASAWLCQITVNVILLFVPYFLG